MKKPTRNGIRIHPTQLRGKQVAVGAELKKAYECGQFWYQFDRPGHRSRVMRCTSLNELEWLAGQVSHKNPVVIRHLAIG